MQIPITVRPDASTPIYLQIRYQLAQLITSGKLREGERLPTVRSVASRLEVNPGTVAQAYRELQQQGLLEAAPGRGTFVAATAPIEVDAAARQRLLDDAVRRALLRARGLGFGDGEVRQHLDLVMAESAPVYPITFAAPTAAIARKYASSLERRLARCVEVHPLTFAALAARAPTALALLDTAYFVLTFAGLARALERDLAGLGRPVRVVGCATEVQAPTLAALEALDARARLCLVTQEPYVHPMLNLLAERAGRSADQLDVVVDGDREAAARAFARADRVVYTFAARDFLIELGVPPERRLEVVFDLTEDALARVRALLLGPGAENGRRS
jgi:GntR family transcriptional regulator